MKEKVLVLPEVYEQVNTWWPFAVVRKMYELDTVNFDYIQVRWSIEREVTRNFLRRAIWSVLKIGIIKTVHIYYKLLKQCLKIRKYGLHEYEMVVSHDPIISYCLLRCFKNIKVISVYHGQGCFYNELVDLVWVSSSRLLRSLLSRMEKFIYANAYRLWFPSIGAFESLIATNPDLQEILSKRIEDRVILYNGIDVSGLDVDHCTEIEDCLANQWYNFVTISSLNEAKWVDRIPYFLGKLKKKWVKFSWILIWKWKLSEDIKKKIKENNIEDESHVFEKWFPKRQILWLLSKSDFYILFHRYSIFDLATLEAMYFWNIPVLSNVWGNKEVVINGNWLLLDEPFGDVDDFLKLVENGNLTKLKELNSEMIRTRFSQSNFIDDYRKMVRR